MRRIFEALVKLWRERVRGPVLRTYDAAREELGGVPWKPFASSDRWFLAGQAPAGANSRPITLDSETIRLIHPPLLRGRGHYVAGAVALVAIVLFIVALSGGAPAPAASDAKPASAALAPIAAAPPAPVAGVAVAPAAKPRAGQKPSVSSQLQKLLAANHAPAGKHARRRSR